MKKIAIFLSLVAVMVASLFCVTGCEEAEGTEGLRIVPNNQNMTGDASDRWFAVVGKNDAADETSNSSATSGSDTNSTATTTTITDNMALNDLAYPLEWSVSDASLGSIIESSGDSALYRKTQKSGDQIITARDQYGNEGFATVYQ